MRRLGRRLSDRCAQLRRRAAADRDTQRRLRRVECGRVLERVTRDDGNARRDRRRGYRGGQAACTSARGFEQLNRQPEIAALYVFNAADRKRHRQRSDDRPRGVGGREDRNRFAIRSKRQGEGRRHAILHRHATHDAVEENVRLLSGRAVAVCVRNDRDWSGFAVAGLAVAATVRNADGDSVANCDSNAQADTHAESDANADADTHAESNSDADRKRSVLVQSGVAVFGLA